MADKAVIDLTDLTDPYGPHYVGDESIALLIEHVVRQDYQIRILQERLDGLTDALECQGLNTDMR